LTFKQRFTKKSVADAVKCSQQRCVSGSMKTKVGEGSHLDPNISTLAEEPAVQAPQLVQETGRWDHRSTGLLFCVLVIVTVTILRGVRVGEFSYNVDETQHAVTGLYVADLVRDHPVTHPIEYTYRYYAQYPALSGVIHWPPLFYCFEGLFFLILGPTVLAARLTVLFFALLGSVFWFLLVRELMNEWAAAFSAVWLALLPTVLLFEKTVMLEIPLLACCIAASFFWISYLLKGRKSDIYWFALFASAALLIKQNGIYLIPFCVLSGLLCRGWKLFLRREVLYADAICFLLISPYYALVYAVHWKSIAMDLSEKSIDGVDRWLFYFKVLPEQLGWSLLGLGLLGILTSRKWAPAKVAGTMLSWIVACYVTLTLIGHKEARYVIYWIPPFLYFASGLLFCFFRKPALKLAGAVAAVILVATTLVSAWSFRRPYVTGYAAVSKRIMEESKSAVILFDGQLPGNFIFFVRADDPDRRFLVLRKALYTYNIKKESGSLELVHSPQEIEDLFHEDGVRFIVVSDHIPLNFESQKMLRDLLKTPSYKELGRFPIGGDDLYPPNTDLVLYENLKWTPPAGKYLRIRMLTMDRDIVVPWDGFGALQTK
jgi:Dolichyl-phosphate-mannose-protein mannosyltransferase